MFITNYPRLIDITQPKDLHFNYIFEISTASPIELKEWRNFIFRPPGRKRYKDLDKQVELFIKKHGLPPRKIPPQIVENGDWVIFSASLVNKENKPILNHATKFCLKIGDDYIIDAFQKEFLYRKINDSFISNQMPIEEEATVTEKSNNYRFLVTITSIIKSSYFSTDLFKAIFKLKSKQEIHKKLIEVFSFKNDLSQRYSIIEELFHLLLSKHRFEVPMHIVIRRKEDILLNLKKQPDYQVYRNEKEFDYYVTSLAEQQLKEEILVDQIAQTDNIEATDTDIHHYLYLLNHPRLREFVHFRPSFIQLDQSLYPINASLISQIAKREKTLNFIIYMLTK